MSGGKLLKFGRNYEARYYPPSVRTIHVLGRPYRLQFPGMVFAKKGIRLYVAFATIKGRDIILCPAALPNVYDSGEVCLSDCEEDEDWEAPDNLDSMIESFWNTSFTDWIGTPPYACFRRWFDSWNIWAKMDLKEVEQTIESLQSPITESFWRNIGALAIAKK